MKKRAVMILMALSLCGCGNSNADNNRNEAPDNTDPVINADFITNTEVPEYDNSISNIAALVDSLDATNKNTILSDTSLNMALGLASDALNDSAQAALEDYWGSDTDVINERNNALINIYNSDDNVTLALANSMWANKDIKFTQDFIKHANAYYNSQNETLDFSDPASAAVINKWCSDNTNGLIPEIIDPAMLASNESVLINALYFNGTWADEFEEHRIGEEEFTNLDGSATTVEMMRATEDTYFENDKAVAFAKYYEGYSYAFVGILPKEEGEYTLTDLNIDELLNNRTNEYKVLIKLPKFKLQDTNELKDVMCDNGLAALFDENAFTGVEGAPLTIGEVIQKTYVDVNESGTEAAAVTALDIKATALEPEEVEVKEVYLDRAFTFMIYDFENNECLFIGKVNTL